MRVGVFPEFLQRAIDSEFECFTPEQVTNDPVLRARIGGIITRSNYTVPVELLERMPALKVIATSGVGFDGIPTEYARERGIVVTNTPGVLDAAVCELAIGMLLALLRQIPAADRYVRDGSWTHGAYRLTTSLASKRVGIVGLGRIGRGVAERLEPFGVTIAYSGTLKSGVPYRHFSSTLALAEDVDMLIVCCRGGAETHHLIDAGVLSALGPDGYLVNIARGTVVDEAALVDALVLGRIRGAALDVFEMEPLGDSPLTSLANTILTPHVGSATSETRAAMLRLTLDNLHAVLRGGRALTPVV